MLPSYDFVLEDDSVIEVGRLRLHTIATPGHTAGSMCFRLEGSPVLFSGDTLFPGGPGATGFAGGDFDRIIRSIDERLFSALPSRHASCCPATATTPPSAPSSPTSRSGSTGAGEPAALVAVRLALPYDRRPVDEARPPHRRPAAHAAAGPQHPGPGLGGGAWPPS